MPGAKRLSDVVIPGRDYAAKIPIAEVLDHEVLLLKFSEAESTTLPPKLNAETGELEPQRYFNIDVDDGGVIKTFSTGATPIQKVLDALQDKLNTGEAELPLMCTFRKEGQTYVIE